MSDKSRDAEPARDEVVPGEPDAVEETFEVDDEREDDSLSIDDIEDPEALAEAEEAAIEADDEITKTDRELSESDATDEAIAELEEGFTPEEQAAAAAAPVIKRKTAKAPVRKKDAATRKRSDAATEHDDPYKAHNPVEFAKQSAGELKKVVWPTWPQTVSMFTAVLIFVLIMITIVGLLDLAFGWSLLKLFGS